MVCRQAIRDVPPHLRVRLLDLITPQCVLHAAADLQLLCRSKMLASSTHQSCKVLFRELM